MRRRMQRGIEKERKREREGEKEKERKRELMKRSYYMPKGPDRALTEGAILRLDNQQIRDGAGVRNFNG